MKDLANKVAFVTGGASGVGLGIVEALLDKDVRVVVADLRQDHLDEARAALGAEAMVEFVQVDVIDRVAMKEAARRTVDRFGAVHLLLNNAGVGTAPDVANMRYEDWDWVLGVNLGGVINGIMSFLPYMLQQNEGGHIVSTSSMGGLLPPVNNVIYATSKYALRGLGDSLRLTLAPHGIGVSTLYPGLTRSRMVQAERNRQPQFGVTETVAPPPGAEGPMANAGMDPLDVGKMVVEAILSNRASIITHGEFRDEVEENCRELLADFPTDQFVDSARLEFKEMIRQQTAAAKSAVDALS